MKKILSISINTRVLTLVIISIAIFSFVFITAFVTYIGQSIKESQIDAMDGNILNHNLQIERNIEAIKMVEALFKTDDELIEYLEDASDNRVTTEQSIEFYRETVTSLERIVNTNTQIYQVRIFLPHENVQEMVPIIYYEERALSFEWSNDEDVEGWKFGYKDNVINTSEDGELLSYITKIYSPYTNELLGTMEVSMLMETMFSGIYDEDATNGIWYVDKNLEEYGNQKPEQYSESMKKISTATEPTAYYTDVANEKLVLGILPILDFEGSLIIVSDVSSEIDAVEQMAVLLFLLIIIILVLFSFALNGLTKRMFKGFYDLIYSTRELQRGDLSVIIEPSGSDEASALGSEINKIRDQLKMLMDENVSRQILAKDSELKSLQNQINAHFIYNVLESIKMMAEIDEKYEISDAITALGKLLRYTMKWETGNVTVLEEVTYIKNYMMLINIRFDYEIKLAIDIADEVYEQKIPKMSLQPIVENAIYHGIEEIAEDTILYLTGRIEGEDTILEVLDTGSGMTEETLQKVRSKLCGAVEIKSKKGGGIGLKNVQDRIKMSFGEKYGMNVESRENLYTKIILKVPKVK